MKPLGGKVNTRGRGKQVLHDPIPCFFLGGARKELVYDMAFLLFSQVPGMTQPQFLRCPVAMGKNRTPFFSLVSLNGNPYPRKGKQGTTGQQRFGGSAIYFHPCQAAHQ